MQLIATTENEIITVIDSKNELVGKLHIDSKSKQHQITTHDKTYQLIQEKGLCRVIENNKTIYHLRSDKFWGTIKIEESNKDIRGVFGFTWGTQLRDERKQTLLKIRTENSLKNKGNYIIQLNKENTKPIEILMTLYGHIVGSIAKQNIFLYT